jgi:tetratricopeptide (TPR) repeat protein
MIANRASSKAYRPKSFRSVATGAMAVAVLAGCTGSAHLARAGTYSDRNADHRTSGVSRAAEKDVVRAERALARSPQNASLRAALGVTYLQAGRFASATQVLDDAMRLGDNSPRTALSLALAKVGAGRGREAVAILDDWRDGIPASDLGLALALAGESSRGVAILTDALRAGDNSVKLRQNLAYAYALDGRWREARTMMEQDVPADMIEARISQWALQGKAEDYQKRVAALLGAPVRSDPGLPQNLALGDTAPVEQIAAEATAQASSQTAYAAPVAPAAMPAATASELPAADEPRAAVPAVAVSQPVAAEATTFAPATQSAPVVQSIPASNFSSAFADTPAPARLAPATSQRAPRTVRVVLPASKPYALKSGSHLVQLGSFASAQGARRGWGILTARNPELRNYRMVITPAVVNGRNYWRVAAAGFNASGASGMCSTVRNHGGACFAYAATRAPAGALPATTQGAAGLRMARRR